MTVGVKGVSQCGQGAGSLRRSLVTCKNPRILETTLFDPPLPLRRMRGREGQYILAGDPWPVDGRVGIRAQVLCVNPLLFLFQQAGRPSSSWSWKPWLLGRGHCPGPLGSSPALRVPPSCH